MTQEWLHDTDAVLLAQQHIQARTEEATVKKHWWAIDPYNPMPFAIADGTATKEEAITAAGNKGANLVSHGPETREQCRAHLAGHEGTCLKKGYGGMRY